jgi:hypothetical protein
LRNLTQLEEELYKIRELSTLLQVTADTLVLVGGSSQDSLSATISRLKLVQTKDQLPINSYALLNTKLINIINNKIINYYLF